MTNATAAFGLDIAEHITGLATITIPGTWYLGLATGSTGLETGAPTDELTTGSYVRKAIGWTAGGDGTPENDDVITFTPSGADWDGVSHWFIADTLSGTTGTVKMWGNLSATRNIASGDTLRFAAGAITLTAT